MKALTIRQPHVAAIFAGLKSYETRSWPTRYRGPLAIHAGARPDRDRLRRLGLGSGGDWQAECARKLRMSSGLLTAGGIIGVCRLIDCLPVSEVLAAAQEWGDFSPGRWAWRLEVAELFDVPRPAKGRLGLWTIS